MRTSKLCWISALTFSILGLACNPQDSKNANPIQADSLKSIADSSALNTSDSTSFLVDSSQGFTQDTPVKSKEQLAAERRELDRLRQNPNPNHRPPENAMPSLGHNRLIPGCKTFFELIQAEWTHDPEKGIFQIQGNPNTGLRAEIPTRSECLFGLPQADIQSLFGKPSRVVGNEMHYYLDKSCLGKGGMKSPGCECLVVELAATKVAKKVVIVKNLP